MTLSEKSNNYWVDFWNSSSIINNQNPQLQVGRSINGKPISGDLWNTTLEFLYNQLELSSKDILLDIGAGSGMISIPFSYKTTNVFALDVSSKLLDNISIDNIQTIVADARYVDFELDKFSKIIVYFTLQHFSLKETVLLFKRIYSWLQNDGIVYFGDVPDTSKMFDYYCKPLWKKAYFNSIEKEEPIIGTWFTKEFLANLASHCDFRKIEIIKQPVEFINAHYRFDLKLTK